MIKRVKCIWGFPTFICFNVRNTSLDCVSKIERLKSRPASRAPWCEICRFFGQFSLFPFSFVRLLLWGERRGKNLPVLSSGFLLGKRRLEGRGMASKREEVVFLPWRNLLQKAMGHYSTLATERREGSRVETGRVWVTFSRLMQRLVGAHETGGRKTAGVVSGTKKT